MDESIVNVGNKADFVLLISITLSVVKVVIFNYLHVFLRVVTLNKLLKLLVTNYNFVHTLNFTKIMYK